MQSEDGEKAREVEAPEYRPLLGYLLNTSITDEPVSVEDVPPRLMGPLLDALARRIAGHPPHMASRLPQSLRPLARFSRQALTDDHQGALLKGLWSGRSSQSVDKVVTDWVAAHKDLEAAVRSGDAMAGSYLVTLMAATNRRRRLSELACMLWACGLEVSNRTSLFRIVVGLFLHDTAPTTSGSTSKAGEQLEKAREETRQARRSLRSETDTNKRLRSQVQKALAEVAEQRRSAQAATQAQRALDRRRAKAEARLSKVEARLQQTDSDLQQSKRAQARAMSQHEAVVDELKAARQDLRASTERETQLMSERSALVKDLQAARDQVSQLEGPAGFWAFLQRTEDQLDEDVTRLQGAPGQQAKRDLSHLRRLKRLFLETYPQFQTRPRVAPPVVVHRGRLEYRGLGGADGIGASSYLVSLAGHKVLIDCGIRVASDFEDASPDIGGIDELDAVIITHAHTDHVGWLPALARQVEGRFEIITTKQTQDLLHIMLEDSHRHLKTELDIRRDRQRYARHPTVVDEPYDSHDIEKILYRINPVSYGDEIQLRTGLSIALHPAGHILGAASVLLEGDGRKVVVTGDFATFSQETVFSARWPEEFHEADLLITESTYGADNHPPRDSEVDGLIEQVRYAIAGGGSVIIPCFALGRAQEVLRILARAMEHGALQAVQVWIDGMIQRINVVYREHSEFELPANFTEVRAGGYERNDVIEACRRAPSIIVTTSGMLHGGPGVDYAAALLSDPKNRMFFTGYLDEESPGRKMLALAEGRGRREVRIPDEFGKDKRIRFATPPGKVQLSAHSDKGMLLKQLVEYAPHHVVLVHGEDRAREALRTSLRAAHLNVSESSTEFDI